MSVSVISEKSILVVGHDGTRRYLFINVFFTAHHGLCCCKISHLNDSVMEIRTGIQQVFIHMNHNEKYIQY